jgi:hypothetical protein
LLKERRMLAPAGLFRPLVAFITATSHLALVGCSSGESSTRQSGAADAFEEELRQGSTRVAQPIQYDPVLVPGYQLPRLHVGNTIIGYGSGSTIYSYYHPNGTLYEAWEGYGVNVAPYWFDGDALCVQYRGSRTPACYFVVVENNQPYYESASTGQPITTFSALYQGDIEGLAGAAQRQNSGVPIWVPLTIGIAAACAFFIDCFGGGGDGAYAADPSPNPSTAGDQERQRKFLEKWTRDHATPQGQGYQIEPYNDLYKPPNWGWKQPGE